MTETSMKVLPTHRERLAVVYVRQSSQHQVLNNLESRRRQYDLAARATELGFTHVETIDEDLGRSGSGMVERPGFAGWYRWCVPVTSAPSCRWKPRTWRNGRDWHQLIELCGFSGSLVIDAEGIYDPRQSNGRLLLGLKGTMSEFELSLFRQRSEHKLFGRRPAWRTAFLPPDWVRVVAQLRDRAQSGSTHSKCGGVGV